MRRSECHLPQNGDPEKPSGPYSSLTTELSKPRQSNFDSIAERRPVLGKEQGGSSPVRRTGFRIGGREAGETPKISVQALKVRQSVREPNSNESLILAQNQRWRRA